MAKDWKDMGCPICRGQWERGERPGMVAENPHMHSRLYLCGHCGVYWEELERYACAIELVDARRNYPEAFLGFEKLKQEARP